MSETAFIDRLGKIVRLTRGERRALAALAAGPVYKFAPGESLLCAGEPVARAWILRTGWARWHSNTAANADWVYGFLLPGDTTSLELALLAHEGESDGVRDYLRLPFSVTAVTPVEAVAIAADTIAVLAARHRRLGAVLIANHALESSAVLRWRVTNGRQRDTRGRLADQLLELWERLEQVDLAKNGKFPFPATQVMLANVLGVTSVHLSRLIGQMQREGLLTVERAPSQSIVIKDLARLRAVAGR